MLVKEPPVEITETLTMLGTAEYPFYLFKGEGAGLIVEGGVGISESVLREQIEQLGIAPGFVKQAVVTHAHPDHVMAVPGMREIFPGVEVFASESLLRRIQDSSGRSGMQRGSSRGSVANGALGGRSRKRPNVDKSLTG